MFPVEATHVDVLWPALHCQQVIPTAIVSVMAMGEPQVKLMLRLTFDTGIKKTHTLIKGLKSSQTAKALVTRPVALECSEMGREIIRSSMDSRHTLLFFFLRTKRPDFTIKR